MAPHNLAIKLFSEKLSTEWPFVPKNSTKLIIRNEEFPDHNTYQLLNAYYVPDITLGASPIKSHLIRTKLWEQIIIPIFSMRKWRLRS